MTLAKSVLLALALLAVLAVPALAVNNLRISQVYGGGGNATATYNADFIELYNAGSSSASLTGLSVQYAAAAGTSWTVVALSGSVAPGGYWLIRTINTGATGAALPTPDQTATSPNMSATAGKVALVNGTGALAVACPTGATILDFVGYGTTANCFEGSGAAPQPNSNNQQSVARKSSFSNKNIDTDQNASDFVATTPCPRNSATVGDPCGPTPALRSAWGSLKSLYR